MPYRFRRRSRMRTSRSSQPSECDFSANPFNGPVFDLSAENQKNLPDIRNTNRCLYESFVDGIGQEYIVRTDLETGISQKFVLPPPTARC